MRDDVARAVRDAIVAARGAARAAGREVLLEHEGLRIATALGLTVPRHVVAPSGGAPPDLSGIPGDRLVVKTLSATILHKSDVGAIRIVPRAELTQTIAAMGERFADAALAGFLVAEFVPHDAQPGAELLLGMRSTADFGPVVTLGLGGVHAEALARHLPRGRDVAILSPALAQTSRVARALEGVAVTDLATHSQRGRPPLLAPDALTDLLGKWLVFAKIAAAEGVVEFEINPLVIRDGGVVALDALGRFDEAVAEVAGQVAAPRPLETIDALLQPTSIAIVGVSQRMNPGRIILENVLDAGFPAEQLVVLKPGTDEIHGVRCVPDLDALTEPVDVLVISVAAGHSAAMIASVARSGKARSVILIPGGFGEHADGGTHEERIREALADARTRADGGVVVNGGNCLGIRSVPGRYNTLFIPRHKLAFDGGRPAPLAVLSQSGAFAVAWASRLGRLDPRYLVTLGNQVDLTIADYLERLEQDPEVRVFACYVEGFRPGDGARFLRIAARLAAQRRPVVLYRSGRTTAGAAASASHTASIAGDYAVCRALAETAGVVVADGLAEFADLTRMFCALADKRVDGLRLGAMSNAGFEAVAVADHAAGFTLPELTGATRVRVGEILATARLTSIVGVRNPLDVTPILGDTGFAECAAAILDDAHVDVGLIGCVPLSGALQTLPAAEHHPEDICRAESVASRLADLHRNSTKAWVAVVDAGRLYDPLAHALDDAGVPTFRNADRALRLFGRVCAYQVR